MNDFDLYLASYIVEFSTKYISDETRDDLKNSIDDSYSAATCLDAMINIIVDDVKNNGADINESINYLLDEYKLLGFEEMLCECEKVKTLIYYIIKRPSIGIEDSQMNLQLIREVFNSIRKCEVKLFRDGVVILLLREIVSCNLVTFDIELSKELTTYIKSLSIEDRNNAINLSSAYSYMC